MLANQIRAVLGTQQTFPTSKSCKNKLLKSKNLNSISKLLIHNGQSYKYMSNHCCKIDELHKKNYF